ncbi:hypothetical protein D3C77_408050 [compost metagenome]
MLDDYQDWEKDLNEGSYNCLLSMVQNELHIPMNRRPTIEEVKHSLFVQDVLVRYADIAIHNQTGVSTVEPYAPDLVLFHNFLCENLVGAASQITEDRALLQGGGLSYWIAKNRYNF